MLFRSLSHDLDGRKSVVFTEWTRGETPTIVEIFANKCRKVMRKARRHQRARCLKYVSARSRLVTLVTYELCAWLIPCLPSPVTGIANSYRTAPQINPSIPELYPGFNMITEVFDVPDAFLEERLHHGAYSFGSARQGHFQREYGPPVP